MSMRFQLSQKHSKIHRIHEITLYNHPAAHFIITADEHSAGISRSNTIRRNLPSNTQTEEEKLSEQRQAVGINKDLLIKMIATQPETLAGVRNRALLSLGYDFLARDQN